MCGGGGVGGSVGGGVKCNFWHVRSTKTQIRLIRVFVVRMKKHCILGYPKCSSEDSDQPAQMRRLIWIFTGRTCPKVTLSDVVAHFVTATRFYCWAGWNQKHHTFLVVGPHRGVPQYCLVRMCFFIFNLQTSRRERYTVTTKMCGKQT